jgi:UDP-N-acetylmuramoyl-tripeptide--D-alanyl-D-alanine ligase
MKPIALGQVAEICGGKVVRGRAETMVSNVCQDTRQLQRGDIYWALRGEKYDGHNFVSGAAGLGAAAAVVDRVAENVPADFSLVQVDDTLIALHRLAAWYRSQLDAKVICVTGSNGKTSTKDFAAAVAATRFEVSKTAGNYNNHIGLPLTILSAKSTDQVCVWEIGMNHAGEIEPLARLARPHLGIITNIGVAHIEFLGSREAIAQEKGMLAEELDDQGVLILDASDDFCESIAARSRARVIRVGSEGTLRAENLRPSVHGLDFDLVNGTERVAAHLPVTGDHMVKNALMAAVAGLELGLSLREVASGLASTQMSKGRLACAEVRGVTVLDDTYNANPDSMEAALRALRSLPGGGRRFAVLGSMGELGSYADEGYRRVGRVAAETMDVLITVGTEAASMAEAAEQEERCDVHRAADTMEAAKILRELSRSGDAAVIKGSRSARMERVLEEFA